VRGPPARIRKGITQFSWEGKALPGPPAGGGMGKPGFPIPPPQQPIFTLGRTRWRGAGSRSLPAYPLSHPRWPGGLAQPPTALPPRAGNNRFVEGLWPSTSPYRKATAYVLS